MSGEDYKRCLEILELNPGASELEIKKAYLSLKKLYSTDSIVISPIADEFSKEKRQEILEQINEAFTTLMALLKNEQSQLIYGEKTEISGKAPDGEEGESLSFNGQVLRQIRKKLGIRLYEVALDTKIRLELLKNIELEKFDSLPHEVYLKGHLSNYAKYLLLNPKKVSDDYIRKYKVWKRKIKEKA